MNKSLLMSIESASSLSLRLISLVCASLATNASSVDAACAEDPAVKRAFSVSKSIM